MFCLCGQYTGQDAQRKKVKVILSCAKYDFCQVCAGIVGEGFIPPVNHTGSRPMKSTTVCRGRIYAARGLPGDCRLRGTCGRHICRPYMSAWFLRVSTREAHGRDSPSRDAVAAAKCRGASRTPPPYTCRSEHCSPAEFGGCHKTLKLMATCRCTGKLKEALRIIDTLF